MHDIYLFLRKGSDMSKIFALVLVSLIIAINLNATDIFQSDDLLTDKNSIFQKGLEFSKEKTDIVDRQNRIILVISIVVVLLTLGMIIGFYHRFKYIKKTGKILQEKNTDLNKLNKELSKSDKEKEYLLKIINDDLNRAYTYVISLLSPPIQNGSVRVSWKYIPSSNLGGDSFGYKWIDDNHFAIYIFDVAGHGLGPALHAVSILNILRNENLPNTDFLKPDEVISSLNSIFQMNRYNNLFFTMFYAVFNKQNRELVYCSAGHPPPILMTDGKFDFLNQCNFVVGGVKDMEFNCTSINIPQNSDLYLYSDGAYEIPDHDHDDVMITPEELAEFLYDNKSINGKELEDWFSHLQNVYSNKSLNDDFSLMKVSFD